ncbi:hypothetical protein J2X07_003171 [Fictibacillus barbaricus]|uniref:Uncharacterized protein n=1 Tax=Fictibacillus barbaricus TaxID=182136 RepID=A0ABU1U455_9BACL|nr:hypothetical protein [Fictibacillus barbaricus]
MNREIQKEMFGIKISESDRKCCRVCFYYNDVNLCSKHFLKIKKYNICDHYKRNQIKVYRGGSVSPK